MPGIGHRENVEWRRFLFAGCDLWLAVLGKEKIQSLTDGVLDAAPLLCCSILSCRLTASGKCTVIGFVVRRGRTVARGSPFGSFGVQAPTNSRLTRTP
jgi:hypothetical protein